ncbi:hypothetical protein RO3G_04152 [Rhizopus delemar RA 99-880]|uniref:Arrestin-like N-terminal domain-containing protein n=1 Tax=Rhizopus delemar (strain RA 99-880 / ATCC MYA-4621 / FGSC 9543 / NRRL 43880) TaxID=246409 RepID=I1BTB7_RHIO9|nr:hypothetical protein RO3G_04152 [Rhizopus delemar RA 99-880]|eukprot:EIE79447.1 hypothetical protein RO3G_04152 [Rhizopus delemar RA 99-880]
MGLLSHGQLRFDPLKPVILRGSPTDDGSTLFAGNVVLSLTKSTKISNVSVTLRSQVITYWPEGIGTRGTRLTHEKSLGEQTLKILAPDQEKDENMIVLQAGVHRFTFAFVVPNSTVTSIEDSFGRVKHTVEAQVQRPGIVMISNWVVSKPVLILRTYMSNSLLTNNSLATLSKTFEKHLVCGDIEVVIEAAAFAPGDIFYARMIIEPRLKHTRIEHMELKCIESRKYSVPEMQAWRTDNTVFPMPFAGSFRLAEFGEGVRHTTYIREILLKHHIEISLTLSFIDDQGHRQFVSTDSEPIITLTPPPQAHIPNHVRTPLSMMTTIINTKQKTKPRLEDELHRQQETVLLDSAITVFDCRLREDYGRLPSYFELGVKPTEMKQLKKPRSTIQNVAEPNQPRPYFCPCYFTFCEQVELASQSLYLSTAPTMLLLDRIPSIPPPDYSA